ncbi:protein phosphatase 1 regulatory subunit 1C isoform X3 [Scyliorhinus canicula]|uniref:protein phosphatase 1 regulatory subunit 1C isoform X3 n=1 Tax=Scyliorhinus canicula TaxID=7830 RepID=UPI0018F3E2C3|nr:protein phosphatase 1 regulatory subunit 1C isoform X3 [Scyliorhinus canicula]
MEPNSPKKIQFAVPLFQSHLDPEAAEQIRRRRPTPASLVILNESSPEVDEKRENNPQGENAEMSPQQRKKSVYTPPTMKVTGSEQVAPLKCNDDVPHSSSRSSHQQQTETDTDEQTLKPRRKDTPFQHQPPLMTGVKHLRTHNETPFLEEEEAANEREEDWSQKTNL